MIKKIILFPGQGSLKKDIIKEKYTESSILQKSIEEVSETTGCDLYSKLKSDELNDIFSISYMIFAASIATFRELEEQNDLRNAVFAGHSLGEITALACAEALSVTDALHLIRKRAELALEVTDAGMYVISNLDCRTASSVCKDLRYEGYKIWLACENTDRQTCIAGDFKSLDRAAEIFRKLGAKVFKMQSNLPYHCKILKDKSTHLKHFIESLNLRQLKHIVISNVFALPYESEKCIAEYLSLQFTELVKWRSIVRYLELQNFDARYEMAYSDILSKSFLYSHSLVKQ